MVNTDERQKFTKQGLTFDDVLLVPAASDVLPADIRPAHPAYQEDSAEYPSHERRHGYRHRVPHGHRHCP